MSSRTVPVRILVVLGALSAFGPLSMDLYLPALPALAGNLHTSAAAAQLTVTGCMLGLAAGQFFLGPVSDRYGRRIPLLLTLTAYAVASLLCAVAPSVGILVAVRLIQGLAGGGGIVIARAMVKDLYDSDTVAWAFSMLMLVSGIAPVLAPVVGGQLLHLMPWRGLFLVLSLVGCVLLAAAVAALSETLPRERRNLGGIGAAARQVRILVEDRRFVGYTAVLGLGSVILFCYIVMSPFVLQTGLGLGSVAFSLIFAANSIGLMIAGRVSGMLVTRFGPDRALTVGLTMGVLACTAFAATAIPGLPLWAMLPFLFLAVSSVAIVMPNAMALALLTHGSRAGTASGLMGMVQFVLGGVIGPLVSLIAATPTVMAVTMAIAAVCAAAARYGAARVVASADSAAQTPPTVADQAER
ncbi:multidrug effflux MFS transporter [Nocardia miyunensis]|uniref:multidrug effflux MFS transporter n=1 Tax=Nocardia miyunensis TaxID=282684 RepID=UPI00082E0B10|nr:multidrug effflux MFS transporter [Nocardia miyunensis]